MRVHVVQTCDQRATLAINLDVARWGYRSRRFWLYPRDPPTENNY
jgi:hypothetical protein